MDYFINGFIDTHAKFMQQKQLISHGCHNGNATGCSTHVFNTGKLPPAYNFIFFLTSRFILVGDFIVFQILTVTNLFKFDELQMESSFLLIFNPVKHLLARQSLCTVLQIDNATLHKSVLFLHALHG